MDRVSGPHRVPSITWERKGKRRACSTQKPSAGGGSNLCLSSSPCQSPGESYLSFKHFELTPSSGSAKQLASVSGGHSRIFGDPLQEIPIQVSVVVGIIFLALLLPEAFS